MMMWASRIKISEKLKKRTSRIAGPFDKINNIWVSQTMCFKITLIFLKKKKSVDNLKIIYKTCWILVRGVVLTESFLNFLSVNDSFRIFRMCAFFFFIEAFRFTENLHIHKNAKILVSFPQYKIWCLQTILVLQSF